MARAKHRDKIHQREFVALVRRVERAEKHAELLAEHKEHRKSKKN